MLNKDITYIPRISTLSEEETARMEANQRKIINDYILTDKRLIEYIGIMRTDKRFQMEESA